jgi:hypothetical protein
MWVDVVSVAAAWWGCEGKDPGECRGISMASASESGEKKMWEVAGWGTVGVLVGRSGSCSMVESHEEGVLLRWTLRGGQGDGVCPFGWPSWLPVDCCELAV